MLSVKSITFSKSEISFYNNFVSPMSGCSLCFSISWVGSFLGQSVYSDDF